MGAWGVGPVVACQVVGGWGAHEDLCGVEDCSHAIKDLVVRAALCHVGRV